MAGVCNPWWAGAVNGLLGLWCPAARLEHSFSERKGMCKAIRELAKHRVTLRKKATACNEPHGHNNWNLHFCSLVCICHTISHKESGHSSCAREKGGGKKRGSPEEREASLQSMHCVCQPFSWNGSAASHMKTKGSWKHSFVFSKHSAVLIAKKELKW